MPNIQPKKPKLLKKYLIRVEGIAPIIAEYEVSAYDDNEAMKIFDSQPRSMRLRERPQIDLPRMKKFRLSIKDLFTGIVGFRKSY